jgi:hypothetical protein
MTNESSCDNDFCLQEFHEFELPESIEQLLQLDVTPLAKDFVPSNYCVLCGRGKEYFDFVGNRRFRCIINMYLDRYSKAKEKIAKSIIVSDVLSIIKDAGGRFCKFQDGSWWEVSEGTAREKIGAHFRDCLHTQYRSSGKAKLARRKAKSSSPQCLPTESRPEGSRDGRRNSV